MPRDCPNCGRLIGSFKQIWRVLRVSQKPTQLPADNNEPQVTFSGIIRQALGCARELALLLYSDVLRRDVDANAN